MRARAAPFRALCGTLSSQCDHESFQDRSVAVGHDAYIRRARNMASCLVSRLKGQNDFHSLCFGGLSLLYLFAQVMWNNYVGN
eukprot:COSAG02_NODE_738_length_17838_cov_10.051412_5_plen_83_part_00